MNKRIIVAGPTATGKTNFAVKLAQHIKGEIINADSMQIYRENPIISAQPSLEEKKDIIHHLFGYVEGSEHYTIARWIFDATNKINEIKTTPILVGGTGFYLKHLIFGLSDIPEIKEDVKHDAQELLIKFGSEYLHIELAKVDPISAQKIDSNNIPKVLRAYEVIKSTGKAIHEWHITTSNKQIFKPSSFKLFVILPEREMIYSNCNQRFIEMLNNNVLDEVEYLVKQNYKTSSGIMKSHGVPELSKYLRGEWLLNEAIEKSQQVVRNYAKRQITWFKHQFKNTEVEPIFIQNPKDEFNMALEISKNFLK